jgi:hypothetical protein
MKIEELELKDFVAYILLAIAIAISLIINGKQSNDIAFLESRFYNLNNDVYFIRECVKDKYYTKTSYCQYPRNE